MRALDGQKAVVYVGIDPIVLAHATSLLAGSPQGATQYIDGDLRDASVILRAAAGTLDFTRPVALMLVGILHLIQDSEEPHRIVTSLMNALPSGSYLAISHPASDINAGQAEAQRRYNERVRTPQTLRTRDEVTRFFEGLDLVPPGVVYVHAWRPDPGDAPPGGRGLCVRRRGTQALTRPASGSLDIKIYRAYGFRRQRIA